MPITFTCRCGNVLRTPDANAGKPGKCPACSTSFIVPPANGGRPGSDPDYPLRRAGRTPVRHDNRFDGLTSDDVQIRPRLDEEDDEQKAERRRHRMPYATEPDEEPAADGPPLPWHARPITLAAAGVFLMFAGGVWFRVQLERGIIVMQAPVVFAAGLMLALVGGLRYLRQKDKKRRRR